MLPLSANLLLLTSAASAYLTSPSVLDSQISNCGSTVEEAKALGCHFDLFSFVYYPPPCYNRDLHDSFAAQHHNDIDWRLMDYTPVSTDEVLEGNHLELRPVSGHYHEWHCTYEWLRLIRALAERRPLDKKLAESSHGHHCSMTLLVKDKAWENETVTRRNQLRFGRCGLTAETMYAYGSKD